MKKIPTDLICSGKWFDNNLTRTVGINGVENLYEDSGYYSSGKSSNNRFTIILIFMILFNSLFISHALKASVMQDQPLSISGFVYDNENLPMMGVTVRIKDTPVGTITNREGYYELTVPVRGSVLQFSFVGFVTTEIAVEKSEQVNIEMKVDVLGLDEVVVIGYGVLKKSHLTGSVSRLRNDNLAEVPVTRLDQALQGKIAGLTVQNLTSEVGVAPQLRVRGMGSISASSAPLVVVDGFPVADGLSFVEMADVESVEVLKDAASSAIYGSRGANGVILVTTRSGNIAKPKYTVNAYHGYKTNYKLHPLMKYKDYVTLLFDEAALRAQDPSVATSQVSRAGSNERAQYIIEDQINNASTDWQQEGLRNVANLKNYQVSVSGGTKEARYFISGNINSDEGVMINSKLDKFSLRAKLDAELSRRVKVGVNLNPSFTNRERPSANFTDFYRFKTWVPARHTEATAMLTGQPIGSYSHPRHYSNRLYEGYMPDGEFWSSSPSFVSPWTSSNNNPTAVLEGEFRRRREYRMMSNAYLNIELAKGLELRSTVGFYGNYTEENIFTDEGARRDGELNRGEHNTSLVADVLSENTLNYSKNIGDGHRIDMLLGVTYQQTNTTTAEMVGTGFPTNDVYTLNKASAMEIAESFTYKYPVVLTSYLSRVNYNYKEKYLLSTSLRSDGSSLFGETNRWSYFPSVSVGWRMAEEDFMNNITWIDQLKPRFSYGITGNNDIIPYAYTNNLTGANYPLGTANTVQTGVSSIGNALGNPDITWERTYEYNSGIDLSLMDTRINLIFDYYYAITDKLLFKQSAMAFTGHEEFWNNIGRIRNKGIEVELNSYIFRTDNFQWNTSLNFSANNNKLLELGGEFRQLNYGERNEVYASIVGQPSIQFFGYKTDGVWLSQNEINEAVANGFASTVPMAPGGLKVIDTDGNGRVDAFDRVIIGNPFPDFSWGFSNTLTFKSFDLNIMLQGQQGAEIINGDLNYLETKKQNTLLTKNRWVSDMFPGDGKTPYEAVGVNNMLTDFVVEDGSYAALREVILGYRLHKNLSQKIGMNSLRIYCSAQNLVYWMSSGYRGINPEGRYTSSQYSSPLVDGYQRGSFPLQRTFAFGLEIIF